MDGLLQKYNDYMRLVGCKVYYELADGSSIETVFKEENFLHLLGLHKLKDIQTIQFWLDRNNKTVKLPDVIKRIKKGKLLESDIKKSVFFPKIQNRYESFTYDNLTTLSYTDAIVDFNPQLIGSVLKSKYILFEQKGVGYDHLGIAYDTKGKTYAETFFFNQSDLYIKNQKIVKVVTARIYDQNGNIILEDTF